MNEYEKTFVEELKDINEQIFRVYCLNELDKAQEFEKRLNEIKEKYEIIIQSALQSWDIENLEDIIEDKLQLKEDINQFLSKNQEKEMEIVKKGYIIRIKEFIEKIDEKEISNLFTQLEKMVKQIKKEEDSIINEEIDELISRALLIIYKKQIKNNEAIDLNKITELSTNERFIKVVKDELIKKLKEVKDEKQKIKILSIEENLNEEGLNNKELWQIISDTNNVIICGNENVDFQAKNCSKLTSLDKILKRTTKYVFGKVNEETGEYEDVTVEYHAFPPKGKLLKKCKNELVELEINNVEEIHSKNLQFREFDNLQVLIFGKNVKKIYGMLNDYYCGTRSKIKKIVCSDDVELLGNHVFTHLSELTTVEIGSGLKVWGMSCFSGDKSLVNINIDNGMTYIPDYCFSHCENLKDIILPVSIQEIGRFAFFKAGIKKIDLNNVQSIEEYAFWNTSLEEIKFPSSLRKIENSVFENCKKLKRVEGEGNIDIGRGCFDGCNENLIIDIRKKEIDKKSTSLHIKNEMIVSNEAEEKIISCVNKDKESIVESGGEVDR